MNSRKTLTPAPNGAGLNFLYNTAAGRLILKIAASRTVSKICGKFMDSPASHFLIKSFVAKNNIDLTEYHSNGFKCFNDCFTRRIKEELRPIDKSPDSLISPCDALASVYRIDDGTVIPIKQSRYTVASLLRDDALAERYRRGICLVLRLCVHHYHRYCYIDDGVKGENIFIPGMLHTVRPIALERYPGIHGKLPRIHRNGN